MPPSISLYIASTLDGFIARADGAIDWLTRIDEYNTDYGYEGFYSSVDGVIMGSTTYELIGSFGQWPYPDKPSFVFTRRNLQPIDANIHFISGDPMQIVTAPHFSGFGRLWLVGGSSLISSFVKKGMVDEYIITVLPVLLGHGLRLFPSPSPEQWLSMEACRQFEGGVLQLNYRRVGRT